MKKILMVLTSHRLDCFRLCMDLLIYGGSIRRFDQVVLLLNGVQGRHLRYVRRLQAAQANHLREASPDAVAWLRQFSHPNH